MNEIQDKFEMKMKLEDECLSTSFEQFQFLSHAVIDYNINRTISSSQENSELGHNPLSYPINSLEDRKSAHAYELASIFEYAFDQIHIIYRTLNGEVHFKENVNHNHLNDLRKMPSALNDSNCNPLSLNRAGIYPLNERDKILYELDDFHHILVLLFRALVLDSSFEFIDLINKIHKNLPSIELIELKKNVKLSDQKIKHLTFVKKNFQKTLKQKFDELNLIKSKLKDRFMEGKYRSNISLRYSNDWKTNYVRQWTQMLIEKEEKYIKTIQQHEIILQQTDFVHQQTMNTLNKTIIDLKFNANRWYEYYQNETLRFEKELIYFRNEYHQIQRQRENMLEEYKQMRIIVDEYNEMKINEKLILEKQKQKEEAIKRIQAWWRGVIVRQLNLKKKKMKNKKK